VPFSVRIRQRQDQGIRCERQMPRRAQSRASLSRDGAALSSRLYFPTCSLVPLCRRPSNEKNGHWKVESPLIQTKS
jgi:hypothetical protein